MLLMLYYTFFSNLVIRQQINLFRIFLIFHTIYTIMHGERPEHLWTVACVLHVHSTYIFTSNTDSRASTTLLSSYERGVSPFNTCGSSRSADSLAWYSPSLFRRGATRPPMCYVRTDAARIWNASSAGRTSIGSAERAGWRLEGDETIDLYSVNGRVSSRHVLRNH